MTPPVRLISGLVLTAVAGFVDALAFIELGGYFASFMSGNTTQFGLAMSGPDGRAAQLLRGQGLFMPLALIGLFFGGAFFASLISVRETRWYSGRVTALIIALLLSTMLLNQLPQLAPMPVMLLAAAMGAQNAVFKPFGAARLGTTFVTGTIFNAANDLAKAMRGYAPRTRWLQHVYVWFSLVLGAASGAVLYNIVGLWSLVLPVTVLSVMLCIILFKEPEYIS